MGLLEFAGAHMQCCVAMLLGPPHSLGGRLELGLVMGSSEHEDHEASLTIITESPTDPTIRVPLTITLTLTLTST